MTPQLYVNFGETSTRKSASPVHFHSSRRSYFRKQKKEQRETTSVLKVKTADIHSYMKRAHRSQQKSLRQQSNDSILKINEPKVGRYEQYTKSKAKTDHVNQSWNDKKEVLILLKQKLENGEEKKVTQVQQEKKLTILSKQFKSPFDRRQLIKTRHNEQIKNQREQQRKQCYFLNSTLSLKIMKKPFFNNSNQLQQQQQKEGDKSFKQYLNNSIKDSTAFNPQELINFVKAQRSKQHSTRKINRFREQQNKHVYNQAMKHIFELVKQEKVIDKVINKQIPFELGINKIVFPKKQNRQVWISSIRKQHAESKTICLQIKREQMLKEQTQKTQHSKNKIVNRPSRINKKLSFQKTERANTAGVKSKSQSRCQTQSLERGLFWQDMMQGTVDAWVVNASKCLE